MIRWLEDNPVGIALAAASAGLLVGALILGVIWSMPPSATTTEGAERDDPLSLEVPTLGASDPIERYAVITERPVFNPSRQPEMSLASGDEDLEEEVEEDVDAPELQLAGVVITPSLKMVTLRSKDAEESLVAFEGQPLEGDYGSWHVSRIEPRRITLASGSGQEMELSLEVLDRSMDAPEKPAAKSEEADVAEADGEGDRRGDQPLTRAEEIRQRIAERREELRRAAEEESAQADDGANRDSPADYRRTIQSMITGNNRNQTPDEDDQ